MRITLSVLLAGLMAGVAVPAFAELQNVQVGGSLRIRGNYYNQDEPAVVGGDTANPVRDDLKVFHFIESRATVNVSADFTDDVGAFIELDSYWNWGDNFRGADTASDSYASSTRQAVAANGLNFGAGVDRYSATDVALYQAYIDMKEAWGYPINFRIGRQELVFGSEWLLGNNDTAALFRGLSYDAVRFDYAADTFNIAAWYAKLAQDNGGFSENIGDVDFYGVYGTYSGLEWFNIDAYALYLMEQDHRGAGPAGLAPVGTFSDGKSEIFTLGARLSGEAAGFDYEAEAAYQFGDVADGTTNAAAFPNVEYDAYAANLEAGYTFDIEYAPRVWAGFAYFSGPDNTGTDAELGFNRLFSDWEYSEFLANTDLSNAWVARAGASVQATEQVNVSAVFSYFSAVEEQSDIFGGTNPAFATDSDLGYEAGLYLHYDYTEDLYMEVGYAYFFANDDGALNLVTSNGTSSLGLDEDAQYVYWETGIRF